MEKQLSITHYIQDELRTFESKFANSVKSNNPRIQAIIDYMMQSSGKMIRPILLLTAAKYAGTINEVTYNSAITLELLHTASLVHDDVVDESNLRRGKPSMNAIFDNKAAVLAGDYYLSTALVKSVMTANIEIISIISELGRSLAEGELNQLSLVKEFIINEEDYFEVIKKKTASLLSVSMRIGAISTNAKLETVEFFAEIGELLGLIFQMKDDLFDYFSEEVGKPTGNDIKEGKVTLPLLHVLTNSKNKERVNKSLEIIKAKDFTDEHIAYLIDFAKEDGGILYTEGKINAYRTKVENLIQSIDKYETKETLLMILDYIIKRKF